MYEDLNKSAGSIISSELSSMAYYQYINPYENYFLQLGPHTLVFLNSGSDSILKPQYLLIGEPSLTGFSSAQFRYLQNIDQQIITQLPENRLILFSHAPILNPVIKKAIQVGILNKIRMIPNVSLNNFKESYLRSLQEPDTQVRS